MEINPPSPRLWSLTLQGFSYGARTREVSCLEFNLVAIVVATLVNIALGALWYSSVLFAKPWMKLSGVSMDKTSKDSANMSYFVSFVGSLIMAFVLSYFISLTGIKSLTNGVKIGFWAGLAFIAATMVSDYMFAGRPMKLFYINLGYRWLGLILMGAVIGLLG